VIRPPPDEACPCESSRMLRSCCLTPDGALRPVAAATCPAGPKTGIRNDACYAAALADCWADISREHCVSHKLLKQLSVDGKVRVDGFPWQDSGTVGKVAAPSLTGKILYRRHNLALSPLDTVALRLFERIDQFHREITDSDRKNLNRFFLFNGHDIERWMLKTLCGQAGRLDDFINPFTKEVHDDIGLVSFMDYDLGYFDLGTQVLEPLDNPFGLGLSLMWPVHSVTYVSKLDP
jgi:hypothetical protein